MTDAYGVVVLAGGAASRLGGADKPALEVGGVSMLRRVLSAVADADSQLVLGREYGGGPVSALRAAADRLETGLSCTLLLAADLPFLDAATVAALRNEIAAGAEAAVLVDASGRRQWLAAAWRTSVLLTRLSATDSARMSDLYADVAVTEVTAQGTPGAEPWRDVDSPTDLDAARHAATSGVVSPEVTPAVKPPAGPDPTLANVADMSPNEDEDPRGPWLSGTAERVDLDTAREIWASGDIVVDVRLPLEYAHGHLPGAINIGVDDLPGRLDDLPAGQIMTVCSMGNRSWRAARMLGRLGRSAVSMSGGTKAWQSAGLPLVTGPDPGDRHASAISGSSRWRGFRRRRKRG